MTRAQQLERWLFSAKQAINGRADLSDMVVKNALAQAMGAHNPAVAYAAARTLAETIRRKANA